MPRLLLGPMLRYVGETEATIWVETDDPAEISIAGHSASTFQIENRHYALVLVENLEPGSITPYEVQLNGETVWPDPGSKFPPSVIRTHSPDEPIKVIWGSCRVALPHSTPYCEKKDQDPRGREIDAAYAYAMRMIEHDPSEWPHLLLWLGDQAYAAGVSPRTREFIEQKRDQEKPPGYEV